MRTLTSSSLLALSLALAAGCGTSTTDKSTPTTDDGTSDTDASGSDSDAPGDGDPTDSDPTDDSDRDDDDTDTTSTTDTSSRSFVGCTGASGTCEGLTGTACEVSGLLGCDVTITVQCVQQIYCITAFDGCPQNFCTGSGDSCAWRNDAERLEAQACPQNTAQDSCNSVLCRPFRYDCSATGAWSCDLDFSDTGVETPPASVCTEFAPYGFDCTPVYVD